jgi:hypothetical protein
MRDLDQNTAANVMVLMVLSSDSKTGATGKTLSIELSKNGGSFAAISPTVTEVDHGWYSIALTAAMTDTLGDLVLHVNAADCDPTDKVSQVFVAPLNALQTETIVDNVINSNNLDTVAQSIAALLTTQTYLASLPGRFGDLIVSDTGQVVASNMRGTDNANTVEPANAANAAGLAANLAAIAALNDFDPSSDQVIVGINIDKSGYSIIGTVTTDAASRTASQADVSALLTSTTYTASLPSV